MIANKQEDKAMKKSKISKYNVEIQVNAMNKQITLVTPQEVGDDGRAVACAIKRHLDGKGVGCRIVKEMVVVKRLVVE